MAEKPETPKILEEISKGTNPKSGPRSSRTQQNARRRFLFVLIPFIPVLAGIAYLAYYQLEVRAQMDNLAQQNSQLSAAVLEYENQLANLTAQLASLPEQPEVDTSAINALSNRLNSEVERLREQLLSMQVEQAQVSAPQLFEWKILEANYLVNLASRKLQLEADPVLAIALLQQADAALLESGNNNVLAARQALADDLGLLREVEVLDREGLFIRLENLSSQLADIDLLTSMRESFQAQRGESSAPVAIGTDATGYLDSTLSFLGSIFVWRRWEESPQAMLVPGQEAMIMQSLRLILEQAQLAVLAADNSLYQRSLDDAISWLRQYAVIDSSTGQSMLGELTALQAINVAPALPELVRSTNSLQQLAASLR